MKDRRNRASHRDLWVQRRKREGSSAKVSDIRIEYQALTPEEKLAWEKQCKDLASEKQCADLVTTDAESIAATDLSCSGTPLADLRRGQKRPRDVWVDQQKLQLADMVVLVRQPLGKDVKTKVQHADTTHGRGAPNAREN